MSFSNDSSHPPYQHLVDFPAFLRQPPLSSNSGAKKVSFSNDHQVHHHHYNDENYYETSYSSWYDRNDYSNFILSTRSDAMAVRRVLARKEDISRALTFETNHGITAVGIIHLASREILARVEENRDAHRNAVLIEYRRQVQEGKISPELLGYISSKFSKRSKVTAVRTARSIL